MFRKPHFTDHEAVMVGQFAAACGRFVPVRAVCGERAIAIKVSPGSADLALVRWLA